MPFINPEDALKISCIECDFITTKKEKKGIAEVFHKGGYYNDDFNSRCPECKKIDTLFEEF